MLMTEEEARKKWCPHARIVDGYSEGAGGCNRWVNKSDEILCIASRCMAWRSAGKPRETVRNYHDAPTFKRIDGSVVFHTYPEGWQYSHSDVDHNGRKFDVLHRIASDDAPELGYCGAFGKPEA